MKKILRLVLFVIFACGSFNAHATKCLSIEKQRAEYKNAYLLRILAIDDSYKKEGEERGGFNHDIEKTRVYILKKEAQIEVLKIYKGDIERILNLKTISTNVSCWEPYCPVSATLCKDVEKTYPFNLGDTIVVFYNDEPDISTSLCSLANEKIKTERDLVVFEKEFRPIWENGKIF